MKISVSQGETGAVPNNSQKIPCVMEIHKKFKKMFQLLVKNDFDGWKQILKWRNERTVSAEFRFGKRRA
ncbi:hypothetical protein [Geoalkalibacter sp.]|uniref:hypothetical protein n=1 Tax=Geoalkalibacter sp. TaxID=3041440 RepID=UPI00272E186F|nr:hypothetical protein [Geoalkalibacter sp.]